MSLKLPLAPGAYDSGDQARTRGAVERADQQNRKRQEDLVLAPGQRLVFHDEHGAEQHFTGAILGGLVRSDTAAQGLSPAGQANARANIAAGSGAGTPGGSDGQIQFNDAGGFGGFTLGGDASVDVSSGALTLATVNPDTGSFGDGAHAPRFTVDPKGRITGAADVAIAFPLTAFNGRTGAVALTSSDVTTALGYTPGAGSVTSIGLSAPAMFTVTASPVTTSGSLAFALASQGANTVLAGPSSGAAAAPAFRALASADLPVGSSSQIGGVQVDGTTITASGGVISAVGAAVTSYKAQATSGSVNFKNNPVASVVVQPVALSISASPAARTFFVTLYYITNSAGGSAPAVTITLDSSFFPAGAVRLQPILDANYGFGFVGGYSAYVAIPGDNAAHVLGLGCVQLGSGSGFTVATALAQIVAIQIA